MSDSDTSGFGKFVPGFDFLQNLAKGSGAGAGLPQMPNLGSWVAPTLNVEELDKRIGELKNVHFWLEQNSRALAATIQALEVQKMTLATLKGMNFNIADMANAFRAKTADSVAPEPEAEPQEVSQPSASTDAKSAAKSTSKKAASAKGAAPLGVVDPLQLWGSLAQQFQAIAAGAMKEASVPAAVKPARKAAAKRTAKRPAARRAAAKKSSR